VSDERAVALHGEISSPATTREALADRFLARVAALTPEQWGRLDAIGQRDAAGDPVARWRRARRVAAVAVETPWLESVVTAVALTGEVAMDVAGALRDAWRPPAPAPSRVALRRQPTPESRALGERLETLRDTARARAGGQGDAGRVLTWGLLALWQRPHVAPETFARQYELVEPVIPIRSLER
jgi:hypothetical protein